MADYLGEYLPIAVFMAIAIGLSGAFIIGSFLVGSQKPDIEKLTAYECGFDAFDDLRKPFDVRFYLVAILFIIFDLEIAFFVSVGSSPWGYWPVRLLVNDGVSSRADNRIYL